jgi:hypothetical protein
MTEVDDASGRKSIQCMKNECQKISTYCKNGYYVCTKHKTGYMKSINKLCSTDNCETLYSYQSKNIKACAAHKTSEMKSIRNICPKYVVYHNDLMRRKIPMYLLKENKKCYEENCQSVVMYKYLDKISCRRHKEDNMQLLSKVCYDNTCMLRAPFKDDDDRKACCKHRQPNMRRTLGACVINGCITRSMYNYIGLPPRYCSFHRKLDMYNVSRKCKFITCNKLPRYGYIGETPLFCRYHKHQGMVMKRTAEIENWLSAVLS